MEVSKVIQHELTRTASRLPPLGDARSRAAGASGGGGYYEGCKKKYLSSANASYDEDNKSLSFHPKKYSRRSHHSDLPLSAVLSSPLLEQQPQHQSQQQHPPRQHPPQHPPQHHLRRHHLCSRGANEISTVSAKSPCTVSMQ